MRISDRYIGQHVLSGTLFAIVLLSVLLVLGNLFQEIRPLLVEIGAPVGVLWDFILSVLPVSLIYTIPWAFLSAVLLMFGRLSRDSELDAFRSAGVSLFRLAVPVLVLGLLLSGLCLWLSVEVVPKAKRRVDETVTRVIIKDPRALLRAGVDQSRIPNLRVYSERSDGPVFHNFHIFGMDEEGELATSAYIHADSAETVVDEEKQEIRLRLTDAYAEVPRARGGAPRVLLARELEWIAIDYAPDPRDILKSGDMTNLEIDAFLDEHPDMDPELRAAYRAEKNQRYSSSLACLALALIGVPLGIKARRHDTSSGLILSLGLGAAYFIAGSLIEDGDGRGWLLWLPNLACLLLGIVLFRRARFR